MKKIFILVSLSVLIMLSACDKKKNSTGALSAGLEPLKIEVPAELKGNAEAVELIKLSEEAINAYSDMVEKVYAECGTFIHKEAEQLTMNEKIKVMKVAGTMVMGMGEFSMKYAQLAERTTLMQENMTEEQITAWATVATAFETRINQINEKYEKVQKIN
jgi:hypothetical protein